MDYAWSPDLPIQERLVTIHATETFSITSKNNFVDYNHFSLQKQPIVPYSEQVFFNGQILLPVTDYYFRYSSASFSLRTIRLTEKDQLNVSYSYYKTHSHSTSFLGSNSMGPYPLNHRYIIPENMTVYVDSFI